MKIFNKFQFLSLFCLIITVLPTVNSKSINLILAESENLVFGDLGAVSVNNHLVFERSINGSESLWSYNRENKELVSLNINNAIVLDSFDNYAVITTETDDLKSVYIFDAISAELTTLANAAQLKAEVTQHAVYGLISNNSVSTIRRFDGQNLVSYDFQDRLSFDLSHNKNICEPDSERFSAFFYRSNPFGETFGPFLLGNYPTGRNKTVANPSIKTNTDCRGFYCFRIQNIAGKCAILEEDVSDLDLFPTRLAAIHSPDGTDKGVPFTSGPFIVLSSISAIGERIYVIKSIEDELFFKIQQLNPETLNVIAETQILLPESTSTSYISPATMVSAGDALLVSYDKNMLLYDADLNPITLNQPILNNGFQFDVDTQVIQTTAYTVFANSINIPDMYTDKKLKTEVAYFKEQKFPTKFNSTEQLRIDDIYVNQANQVVNLTAFDYNTQKLGYYQIQDQPKISQQINGIWFNNELSNQGFSISKGTRQNRSEYVFITAYLFRDGAPLWLAGNVDVDGTSNTLTLDMYEYDGPMLFEPNQDANQKLFGQVKLQLMSCNSLQVNLTVDGQSNELLLNRANNTTYQDWCQE